MSRHLTWANFETGIIRPSEDRMHGVSNAPRAAVFADHGGSRIGMLIEAGAGELPVELTRLLRLEVGHIHAEGTDCLQVVCPDRPVFREAYLLFTTVIDRVIDHGDSSVTALREELVALGALGEEKGKLSVEKQVGLFGELYVLRDLIGRYGPEAVKAWIGPLGEPHDFKAGTVELEVKTTTGRKRIHRVHGLMQAVSSPGCQLAFVSLTIGPAGAGEGDSLPSLIAGIREMITGAGGLTQSFERALEMVGYSDNDAPVYERMWISREPAKMVPVEAGFPAITTGILEQSLGDLMARVEQVEYEVNLGGMGREWAPHDAAMPESLNNE